MNIDLASTSQTLPKRLFGFKRFLVDIAQSVVKSFSIVVHFNVFDYMRFGF